MILVGLLVWLVLGVVIAVPIGRMLRAVNPIDEGYTPDSAPGGTWDGPVGARPAEQPASLELAAANRA